MKIKVMYEIEFDDTEKARLLRKATEDGYAFNDAGPIETITRFLISEGTNSAFSDEHESSFTLSRNLTK